MERLLADDAGRESALAFQTYINTQHSDASRAGVIKDAHAGVVYGVVLAATRRLGITRWDAASPARAERGA